MTVREIILADSLDWCSWVTLSKRPDFSMTSPDFLVFYDINRNGGILIVRYDLARVRK